MSESELRFEINGHLIAAVEWGDPTGVPVLALHGWLDNAASFSFVAEELTGIRLIALDLMGHGYSDHRPESMPYYIWDNVTDVIAVADALGLDQFYIAGHSMGASVATLTAAVFPRRVRGLCLIEGLAPLVYSESELPGRMAEAILKRQRMKGRSLRPYKSIDQAVDARVNGRWPVSRQAATRLVSRGAVVSQEGVIWRSDASLMMPSVLRMSEAQVVGFIQNLRVPVSLVLGSDGIEDEQMQSRIALLESCEIIRLEGGHHLHMEQRAAQRIAKLINCWAA